MCFFGSQYFITFSCDSRFYICTAQPIDCLDSVPSTILVLPLLLNSLIINLSNKHKSHIIAPDFPFFFLILPYQVSPSMRTIFIYFGGCTISHVMFILTGCTRGYINFARFQKRCSTLLWVWSFFLCVDLFWLYTATDMLSSSAVTWSALLTLSGVTDVFSTLNSICFCQNNLAFGFAAISGWLHTAAIIFPYSW